MATSLLVSKSGLDDPGFLDGALFVALAVLWIPNIGARNLESEQAVRTGAVVWTIVTPFAVAAAVYRSYFLAAAAVIVITTIFLWFRVVTEFHRH